VAYVKQARKAQLLVRQRFASFAPSVDVLILSGGLDKTEHDHGACTDLHHALTASAARTADTTLKEYPDKKHELISEDEGKAKNVVVEDVVAWLARIVG
jgi:alpha-beta hydrolase superfamily lysophospholipase